VDDAARDKTTLAGIREVIDRAHRALSTAGARDEALADYVLPRRVLGVQRRAAMVPVGRVWRLGVLLIENNGTLRATGLTTRAIEPGRAAYQSASAEIRREYRAAAFRGRFTKGETVNFDAPVIELDAEALTTSTGPLFVRDREPLVRWSTQAPDSAARPFADYVAERVELLLDPPQGT
jgi:hypothetical protein